GERSQGGGPESVPADPRRREPLRHGCVGVPVESLPEPDADHHGALRPLLRLPDGHDEARGDLAMDRREVLQRLMGTLGAGLAIPALGASHPMRRHLADHARVAAADAKAGVGAKPEFLSAGQLETLGSAAERILPGSTRAKVAPFIDQLLAVDTPENQRRFLSALETL